MLASLDKQALLVDRGFSYGPHSQRCVLNIVKQIDSATIEYTQPYHFFLLEKSLKLPLEQNAWSVVCPWSIFLWKIIFLHVKKIQSFLQNTYLNSIGSIFMCHIAKFQVVQVNNYYNIEYNVLNLIFWNCQNIKCCSTCCKLFT